MTPSARARINLGAVRFNLELISSLVPEAPVMAVVKGNAYGHGIVACARVLAAADCLAVARLFEARQLRDAGITAPIVLLGGPVSNHDLEIAAQLGLALCIHNNEQVEWLARYGGESFSIWVKVDTGMHRLGFSPPECRAILDRLGNMDSVNDVSVMTHFANADDPGDATTARQVERFEEAIADFDGSVSLANSGALFGFADVLDRFAQRHPNRRIWIRPGIALYGVSPLNGQTAADLGLRPAMEFESRLISVKRLAAGGKVGYGGSWQAPHDTVIGTVAAGYGDGYSRFTAGGTPIRINGREVPVVGRISMDLLAVDLGHNAADEVGDQALLWGAALPVENVAANAGTAAYQLITGVSHREPPLYEN